MRLAQLKTLLATLLLAGLVAVAAAQGGDFDVATGKQVTVNRAPAEGYPDPDGLKQVLLNTIVNAIEATPPGGTVVLKAFDGNNDDLVVQIDDSGEGLGESSPRELFEPFTTKKARGTGLGLAVSKQIVDRLHGSLELENLPQGGARCSIRLPRLPSGADK